jgi:ABC-type Na+ efflux pump permease subunit
MSLSVSSNEKTPEASKVELNIDVESKRDDRFKLERKLVRTLDIRMTMLMFIFIFNYVSRLLLFASDNTDFLKIDRTNIA